MNKDVLLIADDDEMSRELLKKYFKDKYKIIETTNGNEVIEAVDSQHIDVMILDIVMPEVDGLDVLKYIRQDKKNDEIGVLIATSAKKKMERQALELGVNDIVSKPYDPVIIQKRLSNILTIIKQKRELITALQVAENANSAKSQFLAQMSHEIRTPMHAIVGLTEIAKRHKHDEKKVNEYLSKIKTSSKVLLKIINDVLDMSAIESNKLKIVKEEFDMKQVLKGITEIYYQQCEEKGITYEMVTDMEDELFIGDSLRINQILLNLVSNAYKFTDKGGVVRVHVQETARTEDTAFIRICVEDSGIGMSAEMKERLFKPFEQESRYVSKTHAGSGLGLSITKNIVEKMHGAITVESEKDKGTKFIVDLPIEVTGKNIEMTSEDLRSIKILVVDDDKTALEYTSVVLKRIGVSYDVALSGIEALEMVEKAEENNEPFDVAMVDWKMPKMNGLEITNKIREISKNETMVIIVSAYDLNEIEDKASISGADHFIPKPLFQSTVFNVLMTLSKGKITQEHDDNYNYDFSGFKALLAEDNELNAEIATELLGMVNLSLDYAVNGKEALDIFADSKPGTYDVILMDVQMPVMDGYEATKAIRNLQRDDAKKIPIYALTANAFVEDVSKSLNSGMSGHIAKPIDTSVLYKTLAKVLV